MSTAENFHKDALKRFVVAHEAIDRAVQALDRNALGDAVQQLSHTRNVYLDNLKGRPKPAQGLRPQEIDPNDPKTYMFEKLVDVCHRHIPQDTRGLEKAELLMEALGLEQARAGLPIANLYADSSPLDFFVEHAFELDDFRAGPDVRRLIEMLQAAGCRVCEACANVNVVDSDVFVSLVVDGGLDVTHFKFGFSLTDIRVADMSLGFEPGYNDMDPYGLPFAALPFYTRRGHREPGHAERECVRRLVEAGADMWPFGEVGLGVDSPPSAELVTRDTQRLMASIVAP